ncbi:MAG: GNAT family N-acetyltransferase [Oligoflexus sp.]|nr:GNAT family N-acetyltransferase [Oligoflexus sp.]
MNIRLMKSLREIGLDAWRTLESADFPFNDFEFFAALEDSGCVGKGSGWQAIYMLAENDVGKALGVLYAFVKQHSYGEYIFDWEWANFYQAHGVEYYPKLLTAVPFTPATGPRVLVAKGEHQDEVRSHLIKAAIEISRNSGLSSYHALFIEEEEVPAFEAEGLAIRHSTQYHWRNRNYRDFQDFLDSLVGKRRRDIVRERNRAQSHGLLIECLSGSQLKPEHAKIMESLYQTTTDKKNAIAYLQGGFFERVFETMADRIVLVMASRDGEAVAAALNFQKGKKLYGRYWGSYAQFQDLHFELCYYQTIDYALRNGIEVFEAGAQGEHKVQRGFLPSLTYSAHKIFDPRFAEPIKNFVRDERLAIDAAMKEMSSPFKLARPEKLE